MSLKRIGSLFVTGSAVGAIYQFQANGNTAEDASITATSQQQKIITMVLKNLSRRLASGCRSADLVSCWGGGSTDESHHETVLPPHDPKTDDKDNHHGKIWHGEAWGFMDGLYLFLVLSWNIFFYSLRGLLRKLHLWPKPSVKSYKKVAVIGAGIAGMSCAWTMKDSHDVTLFEQRGVLGGNAKVVHWDLDGTAATTGTGVLAWPKKYFKHYEALLERLKIPTETVKPKFIISDDNVTALYRQGEANPRWEKEMTAWDNAVDSIRGWNHFCVREKDGEARSFYNMSFLNPMNVVSARRICKWYGVTDEFWNKVVIPVYSSSFLTTKLDALPAVVLPTLDNIISIGKRDPIKPLQTWSGSSQDVFQAMASEIGRDRVKLSACITNVRPKLDSKTGKPCGGVIVETPKDGPMEFDAVVFACCAPAVDALTINDGRYFKRSTLFEQIFQNVAYVDHMDQSFSLASVHSDESALPLSPLRKEIIDNRYANYVYTNPNDPNDVENTFLLASWIPSALRAEAKTGKRGKFFITYNMSDERKRELKHVKGEVWNMLAHPSFSTLNLLLSFSLRMLQGENDMYYCSSYTTPGNGHDLSFLSGLAVATRLGAPYPFERTEARTKDFELLKGMMGI